MPPLAPLSAAEVNHAVVGEPHAQPLKLTADDAQSLKFTADGLKKAQCMRPRCIGARKTKKIRVITPTRVFALIMRRETLVWPSAARRQALKRAQRAAERTWLHLVLRAWCDEALKVRWSSGAEAVALRLLAAQSRRRRQRTALRSWADAACAECSGLVQAVSSR